MIISNNVVGKIDLPEGTIIRVNTAWVKTKEDLFKILKENEGRDVFLDYPSGRTKPPRPKLTLNELIEAIWTFDNVKYFAVSNAENKEILAEIRKMVPSDITIVPKIETFNGVMNLDIILKACDSRTAMLDKEDLYLDLDTDPDAYEDAVLKARRLCGALGVKLYELQGVIFG